MKHTVTYACGHKGEVQLYGKHEARERKLKWLEESGLCPKCLEKERNAAASAANDKAQKLGLPQLKGSRKQIRWALTLRDKQVTAEADRIKELEQGIEKYPERAMQAEEALVMHKKFFQWMKQIAESSFWIEHQTVRSLVRAFKEKTT